MTESEPRWTIEVVPASDQRAQHIVAYDGQIELGRVTLLWYSAGIAAVSGPEFASADDTGVADFLASKTIEHCQQRPVRLLTSLRETLDLHQSSLLDVGFAPAARISFQVVPETRMASEPASSIRLAPVSLAHRARWEAVLAQTFVDTMDCPLLRQLMSAGDAIACFQQAAFPQLQWWIATKEGDDVGCLILGFDGHEEAGEILYLGVVPSWRGKRYGRELVRAALALARRRACRRVSLGVDLSNGPAVNLYQQCGFSEYDQGDLLVKTF